MKEQFEKEIKSFITIGGQRGQKLKKTSMVSIEKIKPFSRKINMNSAGPVSFMEKNLLHETKIRDRFLKIKAVDEVTKTAHQQFGSLTIIIGKIVVRIQSKE